MRILIVEDHQDTVDLYERALSLAGHDVSHASTAAAAKALCATTPFDLLVCDLSLPDQPGWEMLMEIHQTSNTPAIAVSGHAMAKDVEHSLQAGFIAHLNKPVALKTLLSAVDEAATQHRPQPGGGAVDDAQLYD